MAKKENEDGHPYVNKFEFMNIGSGKITNKNRDLDIWRNYRS